MKSKYTTTDQEFAEAVKISFSIRQALQKLNLMPTGGNYRVIQRRIEKMNLDTSHFTGQRSNKGKKFPEQTKPLNFYLCDNCPTIITSHKLRIRLINEGYKHPSCEVCELSEWNGKPIPLELHHCDGNNKNNELSNLRLLCPNCHAQTETYRGKKKRKD